MKKYLISLYVETDIPVKLLRSKKVWQRTLDFAKKRTTFETDDEMKIVSIKLRKEE